jgi:hypothetical protein
MATPSLGPLHERAERITDRNMTTPTEPPAVAALSPFHEVLIEEVAASLPPELASQLRAARTVPQLNDWLAAGAVYKFISDPGVSRDFLGQVGRDPRQAVSALIAALSARTEPPPRSWEWNRRDRLGAALLVAAVGVVLMVRSLLGAILGSFLPNAPGFHVLSSPAGLLAACPAAGIPGAIALVFALLWFGVEAVVLPFAMEQLRRLPAVRRQGAPPLAWRADAFYWVWFAQAALWMLVATIQCWGLLHHAMAAESFTWTHFVVAIVMISVPTAVLIASGVLAPHVLRLGSQREHDPVYVWYTERLRQLATWVRELPEKCRRR